jgi:hypothetical protein
MHDFYISKYLKVFHANYEKMQNLDSFDSPQRYLHLRFGLSVVKMNIIGIVLKMRCFSYKNYFFRE